MTELCDYNYYSNKCQLQSYVFNQTFLKTLIKFCSINPHDIVYYVLFSTVYVGIHNYDFDRISISEDQNVSIAWLVLHKCVSFFLYSIKDLFSFP